MASFDFREEREKLDKELSSLLRVAIYAHLDIDGMSSAALLSRILALHNVMISKIMPTNYEDFGKKIKETSDVIILDLDLKPENVSAFPITTKLIVLDHHNVYNYSFLYFNPKKKYPDAYIPCAAFIYYLYPDVLADYDWLAAIGTISDAGGSSNSDLILNTLRKYNLIAGKDPNFFDTKLGELAEDLNYLITLNGRKGSEQVYDILVHSNSLSDLINNSLLKTYAQKGKEIMNYLRRDFEQRSEKHGSLYIYEISSKFKRFSSTLATTLAFEKANSIIAIVNKVSGSLYRINMRSSVENINLNQLIDALNKEKLISSGGGHPKAAAISLSPDKYLLVKEFIIKYLGTI
jgi:single-stranded DNA-specific DHH superfamily exonuclease